MYLKVRNCGSVGSFLSFLYSLRGPAKRWYEINLNAGIRKSPRNVKKGRQDKKSERLIDGEWGREKSGLGSISITSYEQLFRQCIYIALFGVWLRAGILNSNIRAGRTIIFKGRKTVSGPQFKNFKTFFCSNNHLYQFIS